MDKNYHLDYYFVDRPLDCDGISIVQIGRLFCKGTTVIEPHLNDGWFEFTVVRDGEGFAVSNGITVPLKRYDIFFSFPGDIHEIRSGFGKPLKFDFFSFKTDKEPFCGELSHLMRRCASENDKLFSDERIAKLIEDILSECSGKSPKLPEAALSSLLQLTLIYTIRHFSDKRHGKALSASGNASVICYNIMNYIDNNIYQMKNLSELEKQTGYNYSYISALFKRHTQTTIAEYFRKQKLEEAKRLLTEEDITESKISELLNYSSLYAFIRAFRNYCGMSPGEFKKENRGRRKSPES